MKKNMNWFCKILISLVIFELILLSILTSEIIKENRNPNLDEFSILTSSCPVFGKKFSSGIFL